jgi:RNA ligase (TIGR02306 family)
LGYLWNRDVCDSSYRYCILIQSLGELMSTFRVSLTKITEINPHPNADALLLAKVYDYDVIIPKNIYNVGDLVIYVPVGSVLSEALEALLFPEGSKIKLTNRRIRAIKIRGTVSQGMLMDPAVIPELAGVPWEAEMDVAEIIGVTKYQPPVTEAAPFMQVNQVKNILKNPEFKQYTDIEHGKYYDRNVMTTDEMVIVTQKLHGTSARFGWFPHPQRTWLDKVKAYFGVLPEYEWCWGSRRCQINSKPNKTHDGFKSEKQGVEFGDVYTKIAKQEDLKNKVPKGYAVYGEIVGWGIQKGYLYQCGMNEHKFYVYDVYDVANKKWLSYNEAWVLCEMWGLTHVPLVYKGPFRKDKIDELLTFNPISKEVNEGVVVKPIEERSSPFMGRVILKYINPEYLLKDQTEFQ